MRREREEEGIQGEGRGERENISEKMTSMRNLESAQVII